MRILLNAAMILGATVPLVAQGLDGSITNLILNDQVVVTVPVSRTRVTTISFPSPIQSLDAAGVTADGRTPGLFQLAIQPPQNFFSVRALTNGASANVNVRSRNQTYVLELCETNSPVLSVNFRIPARPIPVPASIPTPTLAPGPDAPVISSGRLVGLLDRAKAFLLLQQQHPHLVAGVTRRTPHSAIHYGKFTVQIDEVLRFDPEDALVFCVTLVNQTSRPLRYKPDSFAVRVGDRIYPQAISEADGVIPGQSLVKAWFVVQGTPDGQRNDLSLKNYFLILFTLLPGS